MSREAVVPAARDQIRNIHARIPRVVVLLTLAVYGIGVAFVGIDAWKTDGWDVMGSRQVDMGGALRTLEAGGPPLLDCTPATDEQMRTLSFKQLTESGACLPAGITDDQGLSLVVPWLAQVTDTQSITVALRQLFLGCFFVLFALYPLIFYGVLRSFVGALVAPWAVIHLRDAYAVPLDHYWVAAWGLLLGIPLVWCLYASWRALGRWAWPLAMVTAVFASFVTTMRVNAGLPVAIATLAVVVARGSRWRQKLLLAVVVVAAYLSIYPLGMNAVRAYRDHSLGLPALSDEYPARHPVWHAAYLGLGVLPNRYGIRWEDSVAARFVAEKDPDAAYPSPAYEGTLRREYLRILAHDPGFVARTYLVKADTLLRRALDFFWIGLIAIPGAIAFGTRRRLTRRLVPLAAPALALGALPPLMTIADHAYTMGWLGAVGVYYVLGATWLSAEVAGLIARSSARPRFVVAPTSARLATIARATARSPWLWVTIAIAAGGCGIIVARETIEPDYSRYAFYSRDAARTLTAPRGEVVYTWSFATGTLLDWEPEAGVAATRAAGALAVTTSASRNAYQLASAAFTLPPGKYVLHVDATLDSGGMRVGALDTAADVWIASTLWWEGQEPLPDGMNTAFELSSTTAVRIILSNWSDTDRSSRWLLRQVSMAKQTGAAP